MKKIRFTIVLICSLLIFTYQHSLAVGETAEPSDTDSIAEFSNPAQAAHAANLSAEASAALDDDVDNANNKLEKAEADLVTAESYQEAVEIAYQALTSEEKTAANERYNNAMIQAINDVAAAEAELDTAKTAYNEVMGEVAGVSEKTISDMRDSKMGWGQIAHELGVHPRALGLGHTKKMGKNFEYGFTDEPAEAIAGDLPTPETEIAEATKRDIQHGWNNKGHGMTTSVSSSGKKGLGLSETDLGVGSKGSKASQGNSGSKSSKSSKSSSAGSSKSSSKSSSASSSASSSTGNSKSNRSSAGGPSNDKSSSGNSSSGSSKSDRSSTGGPSNDKSDNGNSGNDKSKNSNNGNKGGNSGKSK